MGVGRSFSICLGRLEHPDGLRVALFLACLPAPSLLTVVPVNRRFDLSHSNPLWLEGEVIRDSFISPEGDCPGRNRWWITRFGELAPFPRCEQRRVRHRSGGDCPVGLGAGNPSLGTAIRHIDECTLSEAVEKRGMKRAGFFFFYLHKAPYKVRIYEPFHLIIFLNEYSNPWEWQNIKAWKHGRQMELTVTNSKKFSLWQLR